MRVLLLVLLVLVAVGGWFVWRSERAPALEGVRPDEEASAPLARDPASLDALPNVAQVVDGNGGEAPSGRREVVQAPPALPTASASEFQAPTAAFPDPPVEGGAVIGPVGTLAPGDAAFVQKYANFDPAQRLAAAETIRSLLANAASSTDKDVQASYGSWKDELAWLESHLQD